MRRSLKLLLRTMVRMNMRTMMMTMTMIVMTPLVLAVSTTAWGLLFALRVSAVCIRSRLAVADVVHVGSVLIARRFVVRSLATSLGVIVRRGQ